MNLNRQCSDALLLTNNGVGTAKVIGNVNIKGASNTDGDNLTGGNCKIGGKYLVVGTSHYNDSCTIGESSSLTIPAIYAKNVYQTLPVLTINSGTININSSTNSVTGTLYLIRTNDNIIFDLGEQSIGSNYRIVVSSTDDSSGALSFLSSTSIEWTITGGNVSISGDVADSRAHNMLGNVIAIMADSHINFAQSVKVYSGSGNISFSNNTLTIGDSFDITYDGQKWFATIYLSDFNAFINN